VNSKKFALLALVLAAGVTTATADSIGTGYAELRGGEAGSAGRSLVPGEPFHGGARGAVVRLDNGNVLRLAPGASARFDPAGAGAGEVQVRVLAGRVAVVVGDRRPMLAGTGSRFKLAPVFHDAAAAEARLLALDLTVRGREGLEPASGGGGPARRRAFR
jgi:hypothetical protein